MPMEGINLILKIFARVTPRHFARTSLPDQKCLRMYYIGGRLGRMGRARGYPYITTTPLAPRLAHGGHMLGVWSCRRKSDGGGRWRRRWAARRRGRGVLTPHRDPRMALIVVVLASRSCGFRLEGSGGVGYLVTLHSVWVGRCLRSGQFPVSMFNKGGDACVRDKSQRAWSTKGAVLMFGINPSEHGQL